MTELLKEILKVTAAGRTITFRKDFVDDTEVLIHDNKKGARMDFTVWIPSSEEGEKKLADLIEINNSRLNYIK